MIAGLFDHYCSIMTSLDVAAFTVVAENGAYGFEMLTAVKGV